MRNERGDRNTKEALPKLLNDGFTASCWGQRENQQDTMTGNVGLIVEFTGIHLLKYFSFHYLSTHYSHSGLLQISDAQYNFQCVFCGVIRGVIQLWTTVHFTSLSKYSVICKVTAHFIFSCCADWALIPRQSQHSLLSQTHQWWDAKLMIYIFIRVYTQHQTEEEGELVGRVFAWRGILNPATVTNKPIAVGHELKRCITVTCWQITVRKSNDRLTAWQQEELVLLLNL